ncbi:MAG TPA: NAD(P)(+) transhydrogenase (Re/Si-specific) subunit beta [Longimicrobiales bacterium]
MRDTAIGIAYFVAAFLFIVGIKRMASPAPARNGNQLAAVAMLIAIAATALDRSIVSYWTILAGTLLGAGIGIYYGRTVKMTAMPQMVALFNGMGGATAALVSIAEFSKAGSQEGAGVVLSIALGTAIGAISLSGSVMAFGKLQELLPDRPLRFPMQMHFNALLLVAILALGGVVTAGQGGLTAILVIALLATLLGILAVLPIGGADMPVVVSLLNSCTGVAAALTGFVVHNQLLVVAGALVGASGTLLTFMMARAMNRPVSNVLFGSFGAVATAGAAVGNAIARLVKETSADDVGVALAYARNVVVVPGYGLAVAQAQQIVKELAEELDRKGVEVKFAIHPVAGRMPGHMNVVLADANVPYEQLCEMEAINGEFTSTDVVLVIGANDVVNPAARSDPQSPIFGMPILNVDHARNVIVLKRSMNPGFAGIDNELFYRDNTRMLFGDAKASLAKLVQAVKLN